MTQKHTKQNNQYFQHPKTPKLVIILSNRSLTDSRMSFGTRKAVRLPISSPEIPFPAIATTIATGVNPINHGIVTMDEVDEESLTLRPIQSTDRHYPAFWTNGIKTALVGWPGVLDDPDVFYGVSTSQIAERMSNSDELKEWILERLHTVGDAMALDIKNLADLQHQLATIWIAKEILLSDKDINKDIEVMGLAIEDAGDVGSEFDSVLQEELESLILELSPETQILFIEQSSIEMKSEFQVRAEYMATYLLPDEDEQVTPPVALSAIGGSIYTMVGHHSPLGTRRPNWSFLPLIPATSMTREFPLGTKKDNRNWKSIIDRLIARTKNGSQDISRIVQSVIFRFVVLSNFALWTNRWDRLEEFTTYLLSLRTFPRDYWLNVLSLQKQGKREDLQNIVDRFNEISPDLPIAIVANCITLIKTDPDQVKFLLKDIRPSDFKITSALGTFGILSIQVGLINQGIKALEMTISKRAESPIERLALARSYYSLNEFEKAKHAIGKVGHLKGKLEIRLLRLQIFVALKKNEEAKRLASSILKQEPENLQVQRIMQGI